MRCYKCGLTYKKYIGSLNLHNEFIGNYEIFDVEYYKCDNCGNLLFPKETTVKIEKEEQKRRNSLIKQLPLEEFIFASEAAKILNISRQALHKHRRIRRGFIYSIIFGGKNIYHKKSVLLFKKRGDGRFSLTDELPNNNVTYVIIPQITKQKTSDYVDIVSESNVFLPYMHKPARTKSIKYLH